MTTKSAEMTQINLGRRKGRNSEYEMQVGKQELSQGRIIVCDQPGGWESVSGLNRTKDVNME